MMLFRQFLGAAALSAAFAPAWAGGMAGLERFLTQVQTGDLAFTQVIQPADKSAKTQELSGRMRFERPQRFRFDYLKPYEQIIVADGASLWLYDVDLMQVTVSDQQRVLMTSPAGLLLAARDVAALHDAFELSDLPDAQGLQWMLAKPKQKDGAIVQAKLAFDGASLVRLEMEDAFGQQSLFQFDRAGMGKPVDVSVFKFVAPADVDVVDQR